MTIGVIVSALILMYLSRRFPIIAMIGILFCIAALIGFFYIVWVLCYPNDMWFFYIMLAVGTAFWLFLALANKAIDSL